ncbi:MAG: glycosyltransferase family 1 protein [Phycisphaeraceae bacterium]
MGDWPRFAVDARYARVPLSGIGRHTLNLLHGLAALAEAEAEPVAMLVNDETLLDDRLRGVPGRLVPIDVAGAPTSPMGQVRLARMLRRRGVELLHSPDAFGPVVSPGLRHVVTIADVIPLRCRGQLPHSRKARFAWLWRAWLRAQCRGADAVVTVSDYSAGDIVAELGVARGNVHVIYNSIAPLVCEAGDVAREAGETGVAGAGDGPMVLYVGRCDPYKNVTGLVRAFARLREALPGVRLVIVGSTDERYPEAGREAERLRLGDAVQFTGFAPDAELERLYASASLFAFPSLYEGFGLPPLEAMRHGVPVVASDRTAIPEVLGDAALYADPTDEQAFAEAMRGVLTNAALAQRLRERGRERLRRYAPTEQARQTLALWRGLVG